MNVWLEQEFVILEEGLGGGDKDDGGDDLDSVREFWLDQNLREVAALGVVDLDWIISDGSIPKRKVERGRPARRGIPAKCTGNATRSKLPFGQDVPV